MSKIIHGALVANTAAAVTIDAYMVQVTVTNRTQSGEIYFTVDGTVPTVLGVDCFVCLGSRVVSAPVPGKKTVVNMISSTAVSYSVEGESE
jgi:hypothetical protein